jgi:succinate dehydrogenase / fumarate reductase iron-sulfur subunit
VEVCPKDVAPMDQIMRLRRRATDDYEIKDQNNGYGHSWAFVNIIEKYGTLHEGQMPVRSFGQGSMVRGQTDPAAVKQLLESAGTGLRTIEKVGPRKLFLHRKLPDQKQVRRIIEEIESKGERIELNLYIVGETGGDEEGAQSEGGRE